MPKKNIIDLSTDIIKERVQSAYKQLETEYKGTNPYRTTPKSAKDRIYEYSQISPQVIEQARLAMGDEAVDRYLSDIQKTINRSKGHA